MKKQLAKFGVFKISETGADSLYTSRTSKGKPIMKFSEAIEVKQMLHDTDTEGKLNLIVREI